MHLFKFHPTKSELGKAVGKSYHSIDRLTKAGVAPIKTFPDAERVDVEWANKYIQEGLTAEEADQYRRYYAEKHSAA